ncbi:MAG TPA: M20 family peptidase [Pyrinomonadaceae bacterium]|jgi:carboxypeptidase PM20D1
MKKILLLLIVCLAVLVSVLLVKTFRFTSKQVEVESVEAPAIDKEGVAGRLAQSLRFQTVSSQDGNQFRGEEFLGLHKFLEQSFPRVHSTLSREVVGDYSLLYTWKGSEGGKPILLMSHQDVVPVEPGTESNWAQPPFEGRIGDGYIWGRGALDDKVGVLGILEAVELLLGEGFQPKRTIYLAFGHDEEAGGRNGAGKIAALLQGRGVNLDYILDEGSAITDGIIPGVSKPVALIGIAEKGILSVELIVESEGGHSSTPPPQTAIGILSRAVSRLEENQMPTSLNGVAGQMFQYVGPEMSFGRRMAFANLWLFRPLVERLLAASPPTNAATRTTTAATIIEGGVKENVLPSKARAIVNFRILPGDSVESVLGHVSRTINDARVKVGRYGENANEPSAVSNTDSPGYRALQQTIRQLFQGAVVAPSQVIGATDSRHYAGLSSSIYRFVPMTVGPEDLKRIHGTNERISVESYAQCIRFYRQLIVNSARSL